MRTVIIKESPNTIKDRLDFLIKSVYPLSNKVNSRWVINSIDGNIFNVILKKISEDITLVEITYVGSVNPSDPMIQSLFRKIEFELQKPLLKKSFAQRLLELI